MPNTPALVARRRAPQHGVLAKSASNEAYWRKILAAQGKLSAPEMDWRGKLAQKAASLGALAGFDEKKTHRTVDKLLGAADFIPGVGDVATGADAVQAGRKGKYLEAGALSLATLVGAVPVVGDAAAAGIKAGVKAGVKKGALAAARRAAKAEDFLPHNVSKIHERDGWAILTAANPMGKATPAHLNAKANKALKADLEAEGYQFMKTHGKYDNEEPGFAVLDIPEDRARHFGKKYNQDSVLTRKGLIYHNGDIHPARGTNTFTDRPENYFTEMENGSKFALDIDFDNLIKAKPEPRAAVLRRYTDGGPVETNSLHSPYSKVKMRNTHADQSAEFEQAHQFSEAPALRPEDFKIGSHIVPLVGDRSATGVNLVGLDGRKLSEPLPLEGGARYPHFQTDMGQDGAWASGAAVTNAISNNVQKVAANGNDVHGVYSAMGPRSVDFSTMMSDALLRQLPEAEIPTGALKQFDAQMRKLHPRFAGIADPSRADELREQLLKKGSLRLDFVKAMDDAKRQSAGFPDVASTRYAITDPTLRNVPEGTTGLTVAKMDTQARPISDPVIPHTTYPTQLKGAFSGGFEVPLSREEVFPDFFKGRRAAGVDTFGDRRSFEISSVNQPVDQQWIDNLSAVIERKKASGQGW